MKQIRGFKSCANSISFLVPFPLTYCVCLIQLKGRDASARPRSPVTTRLQRVGQTLASVGFPVHRDCSGRPAPHTCGVPHQENMCGASVLKHVTWLPYMGPCVPQVPSLLGHDQLGAGWAKLATKVTTGGGKRPFHICPLSKLPAVGRAHLSPVPCPALPAASSGVAPGIPRACLMSTALGELGSGRGVAGR